MIELTDTTSSAIAAEFVRARSRAGSPAMGMVMTLVFVVDEESSEQAMATAREASQEHPARVLGVILGSTRGKGTVNAQVGIGDGWAGETALIRLSGEVAHHPESVVLPLLLPDSPVVVWWPVDAPADPANDPLGRLAQRRITDAAAATKARATALHAQCEAYTRGNTDLAWTRLTPWRALLAAALDQSHAKVTGAVVTAEKVNPSADLLGAWLGWRLRVDVERRTSDGPGLTEVELETKDGPIRIARTDGRLATFSTPGHPDRPIALKRRSPHDLLAEELRRLDEDDVYAGVVKALLKGSSGTGRASR
ncbi:glucose-6-phosphate dehydrogenase assembly protein OpcA [Nocardioides sp. TRM66260-LWL]|uniref:glucose-6-phosphate dehydrogenase assembly protein OpcA n=1 Tax=Nocardioides sp. TRM66260-LWL TaxID=2874478 RepID=UPI001CC72E1A|nr:glucose-6-phosphate dehydrogenase assembly protein OpcA [Nocardioides sp. TRM66260-LWL]MBZ5733890.1 glucose-6-phosphate dehydrogenase assembly protein OpcA [Nocardioides sp. TRM66260-LWL]